MLEDRTTLYSLLLVGFILVATISYNNMMAKQERQRRQEDGSPANEGDWLAKFAVHQGDVVGETVSIDGDRLVLKQAGVFKSVPLAVATLQGDEVVLQGDLDWEGAIVAGEAWHAAHTKGQDDLVTANLTRSEDVRAPALDAMKGRDEATGRADAADDEPGPPSHPPGQVDDSEE